MQQHRPIGSPLLKLLLPRLPNLYLPTFFSGSLTTRHHSNVPVNEILKGSLQIAPDRQACHVEQRLQRGARLVTAALPVAPGSAAPEDPLVTPEWVQQHLEDIALLDVRGRVETETVSPGVERSTYVSDYGAYLQGHVPGASFWDWAVDGIDETSRALPIEGAADDAAAAPRVQLQQDPDLFAAEAEAKGVGTDRPVVIYDSGDGLLAPRLWWSLMYHGHPAVYVMDGGWRRWEAEGRIRDLAEPCPLKVYATWDAQPRPQLRIEAQELLGLVRQQAASAAAPRTKGGSSSDGGSGHQLLLLDARSVEQHSGQVRRATQGGRIPGAVSLPRSALLADAAASGDGGGSGSGFKDLDELRRLLEEAGVELPNSPSQQQQQQGQQQQGQEQERQQQGQGQQQRVVVYCNGGVASCSVGLALHRLGVTSWSNYDGSWNEWGNNQQGWPVER